MFERLVVGLVVLFGMIALSGWIGTDSASKGDLDSAISILRSDLNENNKNVMNISISLLQRIRRMEKRLKITPLERYQINVDGKKFQEAKMGIFDDIGDFIGKNTSWLKPLTSIGTGLAGAYKDSSNQADYIQSLKDAEQYNYDEAKRQYDYANQIGAANAANAAANSRASAAAASATEANRQKASKKAFKQKNKGNKMIEGLYKPFADSDARILPLMESLYGQGAKNAGMAGAYFSSPEQMKKIGGNTPAYDIKIPVPKGYFGSR